MIPRVIHYCWFGRGKKPALAEKCIASWRKFLPDYEIKEWNEDNYDVNVIPYTAEAYAAKKYAFVSDYARFDILFREGGIYFDTDVEVIKPIDDILAAGPFMGIENYYSVASGLGLAANSGLGLAANSGLGFYAEVLKAYEPRHFRIADGVIDQQTVVTFVTDLLMKRGLNPAHGIVDCAGIKIYPPEYFNPKQPDGRVIITENTRTIHHYTASWKSSRERMAAWAMVHCGVTAGRLVSLFGHNPVYIIRRLLQFGETGR